MDSNKQIEMINIDLIIPNRFQPRLTFDENALQELANSIKEHGIIQPLVLRKINDKYEIIAGERRYKAAQIAGLSEVPAIIANIDDTKSAEIALVENVQRKNLNSMEEAKSYKKILERGQLTQEELAKKMGIAQPTLSNKLRLLNLTPEVQDALMKGKISERHARSLLSVKNALNQVNLLNRVINERLTVRQLDAIIKENNFSNVISPNENIKLKEENILNNNNEQFNIENNIFNNPMPNGYVPSAQPNYDYYQNINANLVNQNNNNNNFVNSYEANIYNQDNSIDSAVSLIDSLETLDTLDSYSNYDNNQEYNNIKQNNQDYGNNNETEQYTNLNSNVQNIDNAYLNQQYTNVIPDVQDNNSSYQTKQFFNDNSKVQETVNPYMGGFLNKISGPQFSSLEDETVNMDFDSTDNYDPYGSLNMAESMPVRVEDIESLDDLNKEDVNQEMPKFSNNVVPGDISSIKRAYDNLMQEIKNAGYKISVEEFDFEDIYQLIIKVDKEV